MATLKFVPRPAPVLAEHRPLYRIALCLLIIEICGRAQKCSLLKLHLINWALKSSVRIDSLQNAIQTKNITIPVWGFDPALASALQIATEENLLTTNNTGIQISEKGSQFLAYLTSDAECLLKEKAELTRIGKGITEGMVTKAAKEWE